jgi:transcriptional regulator with XRE-family HTH domain
VATPRSEAHLAYGRAIREVRLAAGLSQERLALEAGVDRTFVSGIERGEKNPSLATLLKLADKIGVPVSVIAARAENLRARDSASKDKTP